MPGNRVQFILLTGAVGAGKTTLIKKVCDVLKQKNCKLVGFFTEEVRENGRRIGFDVVSFSGQRESLARVSKVNEARKQMVGKYTVFLDSFESVVMKEFDELNKETILVLDEIGKMELLSSSFKSKVIDEFMKPKCVILGVIPKATRPLLNSLKSHPSTKLITVDESNRNNLKNDVVQQVLQAVSSIPS